MPDVPEQRSGHLVLLERVLQAHQEIGEGRRGHRQILDERQRPSGPLEPVQRRHDPPRKLPKQLDLLPGSKACRESNARRHFRRTRSSVCADPLAHRDRILADVLDQQQSLGLRRQQQAVFRIVLAGQAQMPPIQQIAGARSKRQNLLHRQRGIFQRIEKQAAPRRDSAAAARWPAWPR